MSAPRSYDIFCSVVDNFGDAAVSWRLARQLAIEHRVAVRLWIDEPQTLHSLVPLTQQHAAVDGVEVRKWRRDENAPAPTDPAEVVVEAFGCGLPPAYMDRMRGASKCVWVVLEYLSAESWVPSHHGLSSPHPQLGLDRWFFFPGFAAGTGGVLREKDLAQKRRAFGPTARSNFWKSVGQMAPPRGTTVISIFGYADAPLEEWMQVWAKGERPVVAVICDGPLQASGARFAATQARSSGALEVRTLPFLSQTRYDELLWACDLNLVRGEDSFVRAQWALKPFVWSPYRQASDAHHNKLDAFLSLYTRDLAADAARPYTAFSRRWNRIDEGDAEGAATWAALLEQQQTLRIHGLSWSLRLASLGDLASNLARFCSQRLK